MVACYTDDEPDISYIPGSVRCGDFLSMERGFEIQFRQLPFDHPAHIMFSFGRGPKKEE